jgi:hypothetical protein
MLDARSWRRFDALGAITGVAAVVLAALISILAPADVFEAGTLAIGSILLATAIPNEISESEEGVTLSASRAPLIEFLMRAWLGLSLYLVLVVVVTGAHI